MSTPKLGRWASMIATAFLCTSTSVVRAADFQPPFGRPAPASLLADWDIDVRADGRGLPAGSGTAEQGRDIFASQCAACHGATGREGPRDRLVGGRDTLATTMPVKTIGSYWPYAPTVFDYIRRAMPFTAPGTLQPDEVYALVAFLLSENGVISAGAVMDQGTLPLVQMPNRNGFVPLPQYSHINRR